jgi:hypothetical protein
VERGRQPDGLARGRIGEFLDSAPMLACCFFERESGRVDEDRPRPDGTDASGPALSNLETHYSHKTSKGDD